MDTHFCVLPISILIILAIVGNGLMIRHICKDSNSTHGAGGMLKLIGICNVVCGISIAIRAIVAATVAPISLIWASSTTTTISFYLQLGFNVSLAFERLQVVSYPLEYFTTDAKQRLEKKLVLAASTLSLIVGFSSSTLRFLFKNVLIQSIPLAASRILGYVLLCIFYYKLYFTLKTKSQNIVPNSSAEGEPSSSNNEKVARRKKQAEHARKLFFGITATFFIFNLPTVVVFSLTEETTHCHTLKGILSTVSISLSLINMLFDTIWYFYMDRRSRQSQIT